MKNHADKTQENKSKSVANAVTQKQGSGATHQFVDNRPKAIAQMELQETANNRRQVKQAAQLQAMADNYSAYQQQLIQKKENKTDLPYNLKTGIENLTGYFTDDVKVHYNSDKLAQLQAHAYAQGRDIHLASGQEKHLPYEVWHVVQQKQGRVKPTMQMKVKVNMNDDAKLEKEADTMGRKASEVLRMDKHPKQSQTHEKGCNCASCNSTKSIRSSNEATLSSPISIIQRCPKCGNPDCRKGQVCGLGDDLGGLFPENMSGVNPVKFYNEQQGHGGQQREWEHPWAGRSMRQSGQGGQYRTSPVIGMPSEVHRGGVDGMGGGVTSTGSSHTAAGWAAHVSSTVRDEGNVAGVGAGLSDDINAMHHHGRLTEGYKSTIVQVIRGYVEKGIISHDEGNVLGAKLLDHIDFLIKRIPQ